MARVGDCQVAQQHHVAAPQPSLRCTRRGEQRVDLGREIPACLGAEAACVQAHLVDAARNAQARQPARHADRIERAQQLLGTVLGTLRARDPRHRAVAQQHAFGQSAALEHVEPVGQQRAGLVGLIALPQRSGQQGCQHAGERAAPPQVDLCPRQRRTQQFLDQQHLAFPQVGQPMMKSPQRVG
jgi:hypothetical protein